MTAEQIKQVLDYYKIRYRSNDLGSKPIWIHDARCKGSLHEESNYALPLTLLTLLHYKWLDEEGTARGYNYQRKTHNYYDNWLSNPKTDSDEAIHSKDKDQATALKQALIATGVIDE